MTGAFDRGTQYVPQGLIAASVTPFSEDLQLDLPRLRTHLEWLIEAGVDGVLVNGGSGEYLNLTEEERTRVVAEAVATIGGRIPVLAGILAPATGAAIVGARAAALAGASALVVLPPYYLRPSFEGVLTHFQSVIDASGLPVVAYNNPSRIGSALGIPELRRIAALQGIVAVKDCDRDGASLARKVVELPDLPILSGDDDMGFSALLVGARGAIWATPNLAPELCRALVDACTSGDVAIALPLHRRLLHLVRVWDGPNHPGPLKDAMAMIGRSVGKAREPLCGLSHLSIDEARAELVAGGLAVTVGAR